MLKVSYVTKTKTRTLTLEAWTLIVTKFLSMKVFVATTSFFGVSAKSCGLKNESSLFGYTTVKYNLESNHREQSHKSHISRTGRNYFQITIFSLSSLFCKY